MENKINFKRLVSEDHGKLKELEGIRTNKCFEGLLMEGKKYQFRRRIYNHLIHDRCETAVVNLKQEARTYSGNWRLLAKAFRGSHEPLSYGQSGVWVFSWSMHLR